MDVLRSAVVWAVNQRLAVETCLLCAVLLLLVYILKAFRTGWKQYVAFRTVPADADQHFIFGHSLRALRDTGKALDWFSGLQVMHGWKTAKLVMGPMWYQLVCMHPDTAKVALRSDPKSNIIYSPLLPWLGEGLLTANSNRWARTRRLLTPAFHFDILKPYVQVFQETSNTLVDIWSKLPEGQSINVYPSISLLTLDVMLQCTCTYHSNCQINKTHDPYIKAVYDLSALAVKRMLFFPAYFDLVYAVMPDGWRNRRACGIVHKFSMDIIQKRRRDLEKKRSGDVPLNPRKKYLDFIDVLLEARDEDGCGLTDLEIRAEVDTFMFEGHDTTASAIAWTLYNLALYPQHQEKCREEADALFEQKDTLEWEDLKQLTYMQYCIKESLRLYPPVASVGRELAEEREIDGRIFPKGTQVIAMIYAVHHCPSVWENPEEFNPLRFTPENSSGRHPHALIFFSAGPRNCIGKEFAMNEMKVALSVILRHFEVSPDPTRPPVKDLQVILRPKNGLHLKLKRRTT